MNVLNASVMVMLACAAHLDSAYDTLLTTMAGMQESTAVSLRICNNLALMDTSYANIKFSSVYNNDPVSIGHGRGKLDSPQAWSAGVSDQNQWMEMDMVQVLPMAGVVTQGRAEGGQLVTNYRVSVSADGKTWTAVDNSKVFVGNTDTSTKVTYLFDKVSHSSVLQLAQTCIFHA